MINLQYRSSINQIIILISLIAIVFLTPACAPKKAIIDNNSGVKVSQPRVFSNTLKNVLYKADLNVYGRDLSGLLFFKQTDTSMRVVLLSEVGLKYFDIEYKKNEQGRIVVHDLIDFLDHKQFTDLFSNFLSLIMIDANGAKEDYRYEIKPGELGRVIDKDGKNNRYTYNSNSGAVSKIVQSGFLTKNTSIELSDYNYLSPGKILFLSGKVTFDLNKVERKELDERNNK
jgi:hypothetical protein